MIAYCIKTKYENAYYIVMLGHLVVPQLNITSDFTPHSQFLGLLAYTFIAKYPSLAILILDKTPNLN